MTDLLTNSIVSGGIDTDKLECSISSRNSLTCAVSSRAKLSAEFHSGADLDCEIVTREELSCDVSIGGGTGGGSADEYIDTYILVLSDGTQLRTMVIDPEGKEGG